MRPVAVVHNSPITPAGRLLPALERAGRPWLDVRPAEGEAYPDPVEVAGIVVLGGEMGAYDEWEFPHLIAEKAYLRRAVDGEAVVLGICLGAQLLADATGGRAFRAEVPEAGVVELSVSAGWRVDPVLGRLPPRVLAIHQDTFELPPGAELLAESDRFPHAFRVGTGVGLQFHPETPAGVVRSWVEDGADGVVIASGRSPAAFIAEVEAAEPELAAAGSALFDRWVSGLPG
ncbi:MAG: type 1 glutamine amidotransferase [Acidimicrobiia bacterium]